MASGQFINPVTLLRTTPLIAATLTLSHTLDSTVYLSTLNYPDIKPLSNKILPPYFSSVTQTNFYRNLGTVSLTIVTAVASLWTPNIRGNGWFKAGAGLAFVNLLFLPFMLWAREGVRTNHVARDGNIALEEWLWYNKARGWTADLGAWLCLGVAVCKSLRN